MPRGGDATNAAPPAAPVLGTSEGVEDGLKGGSAPAPAPDPLAALPCPLAGMGWVEGVDMDGSVGVDAPLPGPEGLCGQMQCRASRRMHMSLVKSLP